MGVGFYQLSVGAGLHNLSVGIKDMGEPAPTGMVKCGIKFRVKC
jgi:hypothetical protein